MYTTNSGWWGEGMELFLSSLHFFFFLLKLHWLFFGHLGASVHSIHTSSRATLLCILSHVSGHVWWMLYLIFTYFSSVLLSTNSSSLWANLFTYTLYILIYMCWSSMLMDCWWDVFLLLQLFVLAVLYGYIHINEKEGLYNSTESWIINHTIYYNKKGIIKT